MKKSTADIISDGKQLIVITSFEKQPASHISGIPDISTTNVGVVKSTDLVLNKKLVRKGKLFRRGFLSVVLCMILVLICFGGARSFALKKDLSSIASEAKINFDVGVQSLLTEKYAQSAESFLELSRLIGEMKAKLRPLYLNTYLVHSDDSPVLALLDIGQQFSEAGLRLAALAPDLRRLPTTLITGNGNGLPALASAKAEFTSIDTLLADAANNISALNISLLPEHEAASIAAAKSLIPEGRDALKLLVSMISAAEHALGKEYPRTTAVFLQNSGEIRATGGFPGSLVLIDANDGNTKLTFRDIYSYDWKDGTKFPPPEGFERLATRLTLRDANYLFDFPASADKMRTMLEYSGGSTAETIVAVTDDLFAEILAATGPLKLPGFDEAFNAENASLVLSFFVEAKLSGQHSPKGVMAELIPELQSRLSVLPPDRLMQIMKKAIREKWILANSTDPVIQDFFTRIGIAGQVKAPTTADYLAVVSANVGGNKSDHFLAESLTIDSAVSLSGEVTDMVTITREHTWSESEETTFSHLLATYGSEFVAAPLLHEILGAGDNHSYTQVFVPQGAELLDVEGMPFEGVKTAEASGKTVFAFRFPTVSRQAPQSVTLHYRLPAAIDTDKDFDLFFQAQPGRKNVYVKRTITTEQGIITKIGGIAGKHLSSDAIFHAALYHESNRD